MNSERLKWVTAQHLFGSIMTILEPGEEPTQKDLDRISSIAKELDDYVSEMAALYVPTGGAKQ